ncbi:DedA family protein [Arthrobacter sp. KK5.5]|uniref:DedA family protein n=1 Tax=Arthrobacter sp. KK5.5 TaxID=3373084 RepID=UPI003EE53D0C
MDQWGELLRGLDPLWVYPLGALIVTLSAMVPPVPSTTLFVGLGAVSASSDALDPYLLAAAMFAGALAGDAATYALARRFDMASWSLMRGRKRQSALDSARRRLAHDGLPLVMSSRYIPLGRLTMNLASSLTPVPWNRFLVHACVAGAVWSVYSVGVGAMSGIWPQVSTEFAVVLAIAVSLLLGKAFSMLAEWVEDRRPETSRDLEVLAE